MVVGEGWFGSGVFTADEHTIAVFSGRFDDRDQGQL